MEQMEWIPFGAAAAWLVPCAISDFRTQRIPFFLAAGGSIAAFFWQLIGILRSGEGGWGNLFLSVIPGGILSGLSILTGQKIGLGDGLVVLGLGFLLGCRQTFVIVLLGLLFSAVWSCILLILRKTKTKSTIPWIPFLLAGLVTGWVMEAVML